MEEGLFLLAWILSCFVWRLVTEKAESKFGRHLPSLFNWYTAVYVVMAIFLYLTLDSMYSISQAVPWLDPVLTRKLVRKHEMELIERTEKGSLDMKKWDECCNLVGDEFLIYFAMCAPFWAIGSFVICLTHTFMHLRQQKVTSRAAGNASDRLMKYNRDRDQAISVCILPAFYCLMALRGLLHVGRGIVNDTSGLEWIDDMTHRLEFRFELLESCFLVGDVYEAYALLLFANVTMNVVQQQGMDKLEAAHAKLAMALNDKTHLSTMNEAREQQEHFIASLHSTTVLGVMYFAFSCFAAAAYNLTILSFKHMNSPLGIAPETEKYLDAAIYGAGFVTSFAALQNIVVIERAYGETLLHGYKPMQKFWSAKVLVSLVFIQKIILSCPPFNSWSEAKQHLLYSAVMCFECFGIALFHIIAWAHNEEWYEPLKASRKKKEEKEKEEHLRRTQELELAAQQEAVQAAQRGSSVTWSGWFRLSLGRATPQASSELAEVALQSDAPYDKFC